MAKLYITEFSRAGSGDFGGGIQAPLEPALSQQTVTIGASSTQSATIHQDARLLRVHTDATAHISIGVDPTATTSNRRMVADSTEFLAVAPGNNYKIAVIMGV